MQFQKAISRNIETKYAHKRPESEELFIWVILS